MALFQELQTMQEKEGQVMEAVFIACYLVVFAGALAIIGNAVDRLWQAHQRGLARVRAYDLRQGNK